MAELTTATAKELVVAHFDTAATVSSPVIRGAAEATRAGLPEQTMRILKGDAIPFTGKDVEAGILQRFGTRAETGTNAGRKENAKAGTIDSDRQTNTTAMAEKGRKYIESNSPTEIVPSIKTFLLNNSEMMRDVIDQQVAASGGRLNRDAVATQMALQIARSDQYRELFLAQYTDKLDPSKKIEGEETVRSIKADIKRLEGELAGAFDKTELTKAQSEFDAQDKLWKETPEGVKYLSLQKAADAYKDTYAAERELVADFAANESDLNEEIKRLQDLRDKATGTGRGGAPRGLNDNEAKRLQQLQDYKVQAQNAKRRVDAVDATKREMDAVDAANPGFKSEREKAEVLRKKVEDLTNMSKSGREEITPERRIEIDNEILEAKIRLADAEFSYDSAKAQAARDILRMPEEAAAAYLQERFADLREKYDIEAENSKTAAEQTFRQAQDKLSNLWKRKEQTGKRRHSKFKVWKTDKDKAGRVISAYLEGGAGALAGQWNMLTYPSASGNPDRLALSGDVTLMAKFGLTPAEADSIRAQLHADANGEFSRSEFEALFANNSEQVVSRAMADYLGAGGKINRDILRAFTDTEAGVGMIENAIDRNTDVKDQIKALAGKDIVGRRSIKEFAKDHPKSMLSILLAILGIAGVAVGSAIIP